MIGGDHGLRAVRAYLLVAAIVQQDHVAAANLFATLCSITSAGGAFQS